MRKEVYFLLYHWEHCNKNDLHLYKNPMICSFCITLKDVKPLLMDLQLGYTASRAENYIWKTQFLSVFLVEYNKKDLNRPTNRSLEIVFFCPGELVIKFPRSWNNNFQGQRFGDAWNVSKRLVFCFIFTHWKWIWKNGSKATVENSKSNCAVQSPSFQKYLMWVSSKNHQQKQKK